MFNEQLEKALDYGLSENDFWEMTIAEIVRYIESKSRQINERLKEKAVFDYNLANLIGRSISRIYSNKNQFPSIAEVYPSLFKDEELEQAKENQRMEQSTINFMNFANSFNQKHKPKEANITDE